MNSTLPTWSTWARKLHMVTILCYPMKHRWVTMLSTGDHPTHELPGANAYWQCQGSSEAAAQVGAVSQRLLKLQAVLGGHDSGIDLAWMITREPRLVSADVDEVTRRLLEMKLATSGQGMDVMALIQEQPALLLEKSGQADAGVRVPQMTFSLHKRLNDDDDDDDHAFPTTQALQAAVAAWQHGVASDAVDDWDRHLQALSEYAATHGDAHVGARDGDSTTLARWAAKQRADHASSALSEIKTQALVDVGFEFNAERAEWQRWFNELQRQQGAEAPPLASGTAIQLTNWYVTVLVYTLEPQLQQCMPTQVQCAADCPAVWRPGLATRRGSGQCWV